MRLRDLQRIVFIEIEAEVDCASREPVMAVGLIGGWAVYPGAAVSAITNAEPLVIHDSGNTRPITDYLVKLDQYRSLIRFEDSRQPEAEILDRNGAEAKLRELTRPEHRHLFAIPWRRRSQ